MPRGQHPNSKKALAENGKKTQFNGESAVNAQKKSAESRAVVKTFAEYIKQGLSKELSNGTITKEGLANTMLMQVKNGNMKAWELMLKLVGEFPTEQISVTLDNVDGAETQAMLAELKENVKKRSKTASK